MDRLSNVDAAIVTVPPAGVYVVVSVPTDTMVPAALFISGLVAGKSDSSVIGTKPPTSSTKVITLASTALVVGTLTSEEFHVSVESISSLVPIW